MGCSVQKDSVREMTPRAAQPEAKSAEDFHSILLHAQQGPVVRQDGTRDTVNLDKMLIEAQKELMAKDAYFSTRNLTTSASSFNSSSTKASRRGNVHDGHLTWSNKLQSSGGDKDIYAGVYGGQRVAVCVSRRGGGTSRLQNEINVFKVLGKHPHIVEMYCSGLAGDRLYLALEMVEPIGYDLHRLKSMYSFAGQTLPSSLMATLFHQLISAVQHMHKKGLIHRDLKAENVLVNAKHEAKLIDMGIACRVGTTDVLRAGYLAPESCHGLKPLGVEVDAWGLGIILHQVYQGEWKVLSESGPVRMRKGKPSDLRPMEPAVREAMCMLLQFSPSIRWTLPQLLESDWLLRPVSQQATEDWHTIAADGEEEDCERKYLRRYTSNRPLPTCLAVYISEKNHGHLIGQPINALGLSKELGIIVLLISYGHGQFERIPGGTTPIKENSWVYFGVPQGNLMLEAVAGLEKILARRDGGGGTTPGSPTGSNSNFRALRKQEVVETGKLVEFILEFDCFSFPEHIGTEAVIGDGEGVDLRPARLEGRPLHLRRAFKINLVGIQRRDSAPEWFPRASALVRPGDLGLVVRVPCADGSTRPTLEDEALEELLCEEKFHSCLVAAEIRLRLDQRPTRGQASQGRPRSCTAAW